MAHLSHTLLSWSVQQLCWPFYMAVQHYWQSFHLLKAIQTSRDTFPTCYHMIVKINKDWVTITNVKHSIFIFCCILKFIFPYTPLLTISTILMPWKLLVYFRHFLDLQSYWLAWVMWTRRLMGKFQVPYRLSMTVYFLVPLSSTSINLELRVPFLFLFSIYHIVVIIKS